MALIVPTPTHMTFEFTSPINESLQTGDSGTPAKGDIIYYCPTTVHGGFNTVNNINHPNTGIVRVGLARSVTINAIGRWELNVEIDNAAGTGCAPGFFPGVIFVCPTPAEILDIVNGYSLDCNNDCFLMFSKNTEANRSSLLGYYAEVAFGNDSPDIAELFAVSTEVSESSK